MLKIRSQSGGSIMPCCGSSDESRECCREQSRDTAEQVKAADDNEAAKTVHAEKKTTSGPKSEVAAVSAEEARSVLRLR
jgi:hypothetical protein